MNTSIRTRFMHNIPAIIEKREKFLRTTGESIMKDDSLKLLSPAIVR